MKAFYIADDGVVFEDEGACRKHDQRLSRTTPLPVILLEEAIRQCTPYMVTAKERRELAAKLKNYLPTTPPDNTTNRPVFREVEKIAVRLGDISGGAFSDMEGADADEFKQSEALYVECAKAAEVLHTLLKEFPDMLRNPS